MFNDVMKERGIVGFVYFIAKLPLMLKKVFDFLL